MSSGCDGLSKHSRLRSPAGAGWWRPVHRHPFGTIIERIMEECNWYLLENSNMNIELSAQS